MTDEADTIAQKIRKARTDPEPLPENVDELDSRPEALNLVSIYASLNDMEVGQVLNQFSGQGFSAFKTALADLSVDKLGPIGSEMKRLTEEPDEIDRILADGSARAVRLSGPIVREAREIMGFLEPVS
jgi:tryptophanyl-tRNA synthetase